MRHISLLEAPDGRIDFARYLEPEAYQAMMDHIQSGNLPTDTLYRLDSLGDNTPDPYVDSAVRQRSLRWNLILELAEHGDNPDLLSPIARRVMFGGALKAILSWDTDPGAKRPNIESQPPFVIRKDLMDVIRLRRESEGKTITQDRVPDDRRWRPAEQLEFAQCYRLAHGLWRVLAHRITPEYVQAQDLRDYYRPRKTTKSNGVQLDEGVDLHIVRREVISAIAFGIEHIKAIYDESLETNVVGIGPTGRTDLRSLLAEEYPREYPDLTEAL